MEKNVAFVAFVLWVRSSVEREVNRDHLARECLTLLLDLEHQ